MTLTAGIYADAKVQKDLPYLSTIFGTMTTPDPGPMPTEYTFVTTLSGPTGATGCVASQSENSATDRSWSLTRRATDGGFTYATYPTGAATPVYTRTNQVAAIGARPRQILALSVRENDGSGVGSMIAWEYINGSWVWKSSGAVAAPFNTFDSAQVLRLGAIASSSKFGGKIYSVEAHAGLDPAGMILAGVETDFPGTSGNYLSAAYQAAWDIAGPVEVVARARFDNWAASSQTIIGRYLTGAPSWILRKGTGAQAQRIDWWFQVTGNAGGIHSSSVMPYTDGVPFWVKATFIPATGVWAVYHAADQPTEPTTWTAAGGSTTFIGSINPSVAPIQIGADRNGTFDVLNGRVYRAIVRSGIGGPAVFEFNESNITINVATNFAATTGGSVAIVGSVLGPNIPTGTPAAVLWRFDAGEAPVQIPRFADTLDSDSNGDGLADGWRPWSQGAMNEPSYSVTTFQRFTGKPPAASTYLGIDSEAITPCVPGDTVNVTLLYATTIPTNTGAQLYVQWYNAAGAVISSAGPAALTSSTPFWGVYNTPAAPALTVGFRVLIRCYGTGTPDGLTAFVFDTYEVRAFVNAQLSFTDPRGRVWSSNTANAIGRAA
jgi:hypothetical protein